MLMLQRTIKPTLLAASQSRPLVVVVQRHCYYYYFFTTTTSTFRYYLHVGPAAGDVWTGTNLFAAKHLQPDYVKSVLLPAGWGERDDDERTDALLNKLEAEPDLQHRIYDTGSMDPALLVDVTMSTSTSKGTDDGVVGGGGGETD